MHVLWCSVEQSQEQFPSSLASRPLEYSSSPSSISVSTVKELPRSSNQRHRKCRSFQQFKRSFGNSHCTLRRSIVAAQCTHVDIVAVLLHQCRQYPWMLQNCGIVTMGKNQPTQKFWVKEQVLWSRFVQVSWLQSTIVAQKDAHVVKHKGLVRTVVVVLMVSTAVHHRAMK